MGSGVAVDVTSSIIPAIFVIFFILEFLEKSRKCDLVNAIIFIIFPFNFVFPKNDKIMAMCVSLRVMQSSSRNKIRPILNI